MPFNLDYLNKALFSKKLLHFKLFIALTVIQVSYAKAQDFITTWQTTMINENITIPTNGGGYNYMVDWGDGTFTAGETGDATHNYTTPGVYTVSISGDFPRIYFVNSADRDKILTIEQWGNIVWTSMENAFTGCTNINIVNPTIDTPDLSNVTNLEWMFSDASSFNGDISGWNTSNITTMSTMFSGAMSFNQDISSWNVSNVTDMSYMFLNADIFNQDISGWNVSNVIDMQFMLAGSHLFNQDIGSWDVSSVTNMQGLFLQANVFNQNINSWNVANVTNMDNMFSSATSFNQDISAWNVSSVTDMTAMFAGASSFNQNIGGWNVSNVTRMSDMFTRASDFNIDIGNWNVTNVTNMERMFRNATSFDQNLGNWNVENVTNAELMFFLVTLSTENYDSLLIGWNAQNLQPNVVFDGGNSQYCAGEAARENMITSDNWTITDGGFIVITADTLPDTTECSNYELPPLAANNFYYTGSGANGAQLSEGDLITSTQQIFIYTGTSTCNDESSFNVTISESPLVDTLSDVLECENYTLPILSPRNNYYTETDASGTPLMAGDVIGSTEEIFIYTENAEGCSNESSFVVTIENTEVDESEDVEACEVFILPTLDNGNYFSEPNGTGTSFFAGDEITNSQTLFIYNDSGSCSAESSFNIIIGVEFCEVSDLFPNYFTPNGDGFHDFWNIDTSQANIIAGTIRIFDRFGKLLKQFNSTQSLGWNGTYNGRYLPSSQYWFTFISSDNTIVKGSFSLIR